MKVWTALSLVALAFADVAVGQEKVAINTITRIEVKGGTIEIVGTQKPNFTSFTMSDPPRLVIDITEAVLGKGIEEEKQVGMGLSLRSKRPATAPMCLQSHAFWSDLAKSHKPRSKPWAPP